MADDRGAGINSASVFAAMERQIPDDAVIAVDVGNHAYSFGRYFECKRHTVLMSGYLGKACEQCLDAEGFFCTGDGGRVEPLTGGRGRGGLRRVVPGSRGGSRSGPGGRASGPGPRAASGRRVWRSTPRPNRAGPTAGSRRW